MKNIIIVRTCRESAAGTNGHMEKVNHQQLIIEERLAPRCRRPLEEGSACVRIRAIKRGEGSACARGEPQKTKIIFLLILKVFEICFVISVFFFLFFFLNILSCFSFFFLLCV